MILKLIILNSIIAILVNCLFCFNRTSYILLHSIMLFLFSAAYMVYLEFEFLGLIFATIYVGGIAVMFLFLILVVDVRVENSRKLLFWDRKLLFRIFLTISLATFFSYVFLLLVEPTLFFNIDFFINCNSQLIRWDLELTKYVPNNYAKFGTTFIRKYFVDAVDNVDDIYVLGVLLFTDHPVLLVIAGLFLLIVTIVSVILCMNIYN